MENNNIDTPESRSSYISRLRSLSTEGIPIDDTLVSKDFDTLILNLKNSDELHGRQRSDQNYRTLRSALNKYRDFIVFRSDIHGDIEKIRSDDSIGKTEKQQLINARKGQGKFKDDLITLRGKCAISGAVGKEFIVASHIAPWKSSSNEERLDKFNGLLLIPNFDKLFDRGYISFEDDGKIIVSKELSEEMKSIYGINEQVQIEIFEENRKYLQKHRELFQARLK